MFAAVLVDDPQVAVGVRGEEQGRVVPVPAAGGVEVQGMHDGVAVGDVLSELGQVVEVLAGFAVGQNPGYGPGRTGRCRYSLGLLDSELVLLRHPEHPP